jgi:4,5-DOPA dioxygenase extradiol
MTPRQHYELAQEMRYLRSEGILIMGSGNMVHNLREIDWQNPESGYDWAQEVDEKMKNRLSNHDHDNLIDFRAQGPEFRLAIPTAEHYLPLLYVIGLQDEQDELTFFNEEICMGSLSMTSVMLK